MLRLPPPLDEFSSVRFVAGNAIPAFEDLLARMVVPSGSRIRVVDPSSIRIVARSILDTGVGPLALSDHEAMK